MLFHNVDIENWEITEPLIAEYNLKVRNVLLEIQTDYGFILHCCGMEYDAVAVWTNLLKILVRRSSMPLVQQTNHNVNSSLNFHSHCCPNNSFPGRSRTSDKEAWEEIHRLGEVANQWKRSQKTACTKRQTGSAWYTTVLTYSRQASMGICEVQQK